MVFTPRKQDLAVSIKDGRWSEQKARLLSSGLKIFYVLEGDFRNVAALPYGALVGAYLNASLLEGVEAFRTVEHSGDQIFVSDTRQEMSSHF